MALEINRESRGCVLGQDTMDLYQKSKIQFSLINE